MFDPFKDFEQAGYLRNRYGEKDPKIVQELEHQLFRAGLGEALTHLARCRDCHSMFWACSRICSMSSFKSIAARVMSMLPALEPSVLASRFIS